MADGLICPVSLCKLTRVEKQFPSEEDLRAHLLDAHARSVKKNGLQELIDYSKAHPGDFTESYLAGWREFDEREAQRIANEKPLKTEARYIVLPIRTGVN